MLLQARRLITKQQNLNVVKRSLRTTTKRKNNVMNQILEGDSGKGILSTKMYHYTVYGSVALFPVALALSPSKLNIPVDVALGLIFPIHAHIGMNYVISDYVPKGLRGAARTGWLGVTAIKIPVRSRYIPKFFEQLAAIKHWGSLLANFRVNRASCSSPSPKP